LKVTTSAFTTCGISRPGDGGNGRSRNSSPVELTGLVEHGDARGRELGYPTANVPVQDGKIRDGVWVGTVCVDPEGLGQSFAAAISVGRRPTYYRKGTRLLEAHLLDFSGDLYGHTVLVTFHSYIRPQRKFRGTTELVAQIRRDVECVRSWTALACAEHESKGDHHLCPAFVTVNTPQWQGGLT